VAAKTDMPKFAISL
jgi:hypothetical protein